MQSRCMVKLNHLSVRVRDWKRSRDWYVQSVGIWDAKSMKEKGN